MAYAITDHVARAAGHTRTVHQLLDVHARLRDHVIPNALTALEAARSSPFMMPFRGLLTARVEKVRADLFSAEGAVATLLAPVQIPRWLWRNGEEWTHVTAELSAMVGDLNVTNREIHLRWRGVAADAYHSVLPAHVGAAAQLAESAGTISYTLDWAGTTAAVFYAGLLAILLQAAAGIATAAATVAVDPSGIGTLAVLALMAATLVAEIGVLVALSADAYGRMKVWMMQLLGELYDTSNFPNGDWPAPRSQWYADATVTDGDADWSVAR